MPDQNGLEKREPDFRRLARLAAQRAAEVGRKGAERAEEAKDQVRQRLGEDYYSILNKNPIIEDTMARESLIVGDKVLLETVFNVPWVTTLLWSAAAGSAVSLQGPIAKVAGELAHYGPGHVGAWDAVNKFMDTVVGSGHRLKFGHSIEYLPQIIEKFGITGVPAYFMHLAQDFSTPHGIPIVPDAWEVKSWLQLKGLTAPAAAGAVSVSFASMLGAIALVALAHNLWKFSDAAVKSLKARKHLKLATDAAGNEDYLTAETYLKRALEVKRNPAIMMALGQVYMRTEPKRLSAHNLFREALGPDLRPDSTVTYGGARLSIRGQAGIYALATAEVLARIHRDQWNDHVQDLVRTTVHSFESTAARLAKPNIIRDALVPPAHLSAGINYYLAAKAASYYPLAENRQEVVTRNVESALKSVGVMAQYDEDSLRQPADAIKQLWARELLPPTESETALATH